MAPSKDSSADSDATYLLEVIATLDDFKGDWKALAIKHGIAPSNSYRRFKKIVEKNGFSYENRKVTKNGEDAENDVGAVQTPKKAEAGRKKNGTGTPYSKKRKLSEATADDNKVEEGVDDVKDEADEQDNANGEDLA